jgi:hypothetical protein
MEHIGHTSPRTSRLDTTRRSKYVLTPGSRRAPTRHPLLAVLCACALGLMACGGGGDSGAADGSEPDVTLPPEAGSSAIGTSAPADARRWQP